MIDVDSIGRTKDGALMVADLLEKRGLHHEVAHRPPLWILKVPAELKIALNNVHVPTLAWSREVPDGLACTDIDANAAYMSAASSGTFAHGQLEHTGPWPDDEFIHPGLYLVDVHPWQFEAPGSPLGAAHITRPQVWVTHHTYRLLRDLTFGTGWAPGGHWPDATAYDSWTCRNPMRLTKWTNAIRDIRGHMIDMGDDEGYASLKLGYSQAVQMWATPPDPKGTEPKARKKHTRAYRPDWYAALRSQHAFNLWRRAYIATLAGHPPLALGGRGHAVDGMAFRTSDLTAALAMPKSPIQLDPSGRQFGTFRQTRRYFSGQDEVDGQ